MEPKKTENSAFQSSVRRVSAALYGLLNEQESSDSLRIKIIRLSHYYKLVYFVLKYEEVLFIAGRSQKTPHHWAIRRAATLNPMDSGEIMSELRAAECICID